MLVSIIVALSETRVIGYRNQLPWQLPADLAYFRRMTLGKPIMMGRKTYESIGRPLPGRDNYIITRNANYTVPGAQVFPSVAAALASVSGDVEEVMVMGGGQIYQAVLAQAQRLYMTWVEGEFEGDTYFPDYDASAWTLLSSDPHVADHQHAHAYTFKIFQRKSGILPHRPR